VVLLGLMLVGSLYETAAEAADARAILPPGDLVQVEGFRLHLYCTGAGGPTVVIDAGWGDWSPTWSSWVQPAVAGTTRVCTYDRAGYGFSEVGPSPRTTERFVQELHALLHAAQEPGPYVMVGHSLGGANMRVFAHEYAAEVAGVVLIDSMNPSQVDRPAEASTPPPDSASPEDWLLALPARVGLLRLLAGPLGLSSGLSPEVANRYVAFWVTPRFVQINLDEGRGMPSGLALASSVQNIGEIPLIVLSRGKDNDEQHQREQHELLQLSLRSQQILADHSGHNIQLEQPEAAVAAIVKMVEQLR
jgi:pimeloyl-ACP methyl ester carboxylesterase